MKKSLVVIALVLICCVALCACNKSNSIPWEEGGKAPTEYTWKEFEKLTGEQQIKFQEAFEDFEAFEEWMDGAQLEAIETPWEEEGEKQPEDYTWEEFEKLDKDQQMKFQNSFEDIDAFSKWMDKAQGIEVELPWENGGKAPIEYTWDEYCDLTGPQQIKFQDYFDDIEDFDMWLQSVKSE